MHQLPNAKQLFEIVADEKGLLPDIIEKDYWLMHCLWGIQQQRYQFELKGGTSLSKGFGIIERFSEDIDIQIHPDDEEVKTGKNQDKPAHHMHEPTTIVPHARTLRKAREQIRLMVFDGLSAKRIRNYLHRFVMWWQNTSTTWEYQELLQQFIDVCWSQRVANYATALLQIHLTKLHTRSLCDLAGAVGAA